MSNNTQRYEVVAPMPHFTHLFKGDILVPKQHALCDLCWGADDEEDVHKWITFCPDYPHLFRLLSWWEHVPLDELPKYVKIRESEIVLKVTDWHTGSIFNVVWGKVVDSNLYNTVYTWWANPATEAEYNDYLTKLNGK